MYLEVLEPALLIVGLVMYLVSLGMFIKRTGDVRAVLMFWEARMHMNQKEFITNRLGLTIMFMGIVLRFLNNFM